MTTVSRVYDSYSQAAQAVAAVEAAGIPSSEISLVANKYVSAEHADVDEVSDTAKGAGIGGALGGGAALLAGLGMIAIPGLGPVVAAGWLAAAAVGAAAGATTGGVIGALVGAGTSEEDANIYSEAVRRGGTLVSARARPEDAQRIQTILDSYAPVDTVERHAAYRKEGWTTFDPSSPAHKPNQAEIDTIRREWRR